MKAAQYNAFSADSNPETIKLDSVAALKAPESGRVTVKIYAASLNPVDHKVILFRFTYNLWIKAT